MGSLPALDYTIPPGWTNVSRASKPPAVAGAMMAYSSKDHRFLFFGGWDGARGLNETWVFDPGNRTWTELHPVVSPTERGDEMFVYADREDSFVLFGGWFEFPNGTYRRLSDTWRFSLRTGTWVERHPAQAPSPRSDSEVAYDPATDAALLVGGFDGSTYLGDIWSYSLTTQTWSPHPSSVQPSPRADGRMAYVPSQGRFILFGGNDYNGPNFTFHHLSDTWSYDWNSNVWTVLPTGIAPPARDYPVLGEDLMAHLILVSSGYGNRTILNDLWGLNLTTDSWSDLTPALSPPPRFAATGGYDPENDVFVLVGGAGNEGLLPDTWFYRYGSSIQVPDGLSPIVVLGSGAIAAGVITVGILLRMSRRRRS